ncbi:response regulator [Alkanindiges illinoisensis]|uniref:Response regulator n=1 Tax=Alkanindiges illinoisensis TaxID=197183 RepID=A0A4Y7XA24_9GAMM|nr:response regulator [Alkanindiges illinoisensis]TEU24728.1 response regulator [Alkanindiges illinoisensis]
MAKIFIIEDEKELAELVRDYLVQANYEVEIFNDGQTGLQAALQDNPDLIILDLMLPRLDGLGVCRKLREVSNVPIIMVTALTEEIDRLLGLKLGADDYVCKPFSPKELVARVQAVLRRAHSQPAQKALFKIDESQQRIWYKQKTLNLTPTEFRLLALFLKHVGQIFSRGQLLDHLNPDSFEVTDRVIDSHIKNLRRKISETADTGSKHEWIHSVYGVGYRFDYDENQ